MKKLAVVILGLVLLFGCGKSESLQEERNHLFPIEKDGKYGYIDQTGKIIIKPQFEYARDFSEGLARASIGDGDTYKNGDIDKTGKFVIGPWTGGASGFSDGLARASFGDWRTAKTGYIDKTGKIVIEPQFEDAGNFHNGLARISFGERKNYDYNGVILTKKERLSGYRTKRKTL